MEKSLAGVHFMNMQISEYFPVATPLTAPVQGQLKGLLKKWLYKGLICLFKGNISQRHLYYVCMCTHFLPARSGMHV